MVFAFLSWASRFHTCGERDQGRDEDGDGVGDGDRQREGNSNQHLTRWATELRPSHPERLFVSGASRGGWAVAGFSYSCSPGLFLRVQRLLSFV